MKDIAVVVLLIVGAYFVYQYFIPPTGFYYEKVSRATVDASLSQSNHFPVAVSGEVSPNLKTLCVYIVENSCTNLSVQIGHRLYYDTFNVPGCGDAKRWFACKPNKLSVVDGRWSADVYPIGGEKTLPPGTYFVALTSATPDEITYDYVIATGKITLY